MAELLRDVAFQLIRRDAADPEDPDAVPDAGQKETFSSFAIFILIMLLIVALFTSYILQQRKIQAVHETVLSIFAGMIVGLILRVGSSTFVRGVVSFDQQFFFNLLLPPIILGAGYELHQANFFRNIGPILTFAFAGTFISAVVLGIILWLWTRIPLGFSISFIEAFSVGATLSATDPVTILAIFNAYKVDPKLYTVIFGESILNDAIAIVLFETAQKYVDTGGKKPDSLSVGTFFEAIGIFLLVFFGSLVIGVAVGILTTLGLKFTLVRRFPKIESCLIILIAYASYFFSTGIKMSGIVSLLFCGITLKHYAYYNMSRRTQLTTKFVFQTLAQLSENFIFIYLGLTLFTEQQLEFKPLFILITVVGVCAARYAAVFPLSKIINWTYRFRARRRGQPDVADELPHSYQVMLFWAGLRGAVGVALAAGLESSPGNFRALQATVLVVVVLTVIIFGGTTARMLDIMGIRTGVVEEVDSDDEFDIEPVANGTYYKRSGTAFGHTPTRSDFTGTVGLDKLDPAGGGAANGGPRGTGTGAEPLPTPRTGVPRSGSWADGGEESYSSSSARASPPSRAAHAKRTGSTPGSRDRDAATALLGPSNSGRGSRARSPGRGALDADDDDDWSEPDLPPAAPRRSPKSRPSPPPAAPSRPARSNTLPLPGDPGRGAPALPPPGAPPEGLTASEAIRDFFTGTEDRAAWFRRLDEAVIKPTLLLDQSSKGGGGGGSGAGGGGAGGGGGGGGHGHGHGHGQGHG